MIQAQGYLNYYPKNHLKPLEKLGNTFEMILIHIKFLKKILRLSLNYS